MFAACIRSDIVKSLDSRKIVFNGLLNHYNDTLACMESIIGAISLIDIKNLLS